MGSLGTHYQAQKRLAPQRTEEKIATRIPRSRAGKTDETQGTIVKSSMATRCMAVVSPDVNPVIA